MSSLMFCTRICLFSHFSAFHLTLMPSFKFAVASFIYIFMFIALLHRYVSHVSRGQSHTCDADLYHLAFTLQSFISSRSNSEVESQTYSHVVPTSKPLHSYSWSHVTWAVTYMWRGPISPHIHTTEFSSYTIQVYFWSWIADPQPSHTCLIPLLLQISILTSPPYTEPCTAIWVTRRGYISTVLLKVTIFRSPYLWLSITLLKVTIVRNIVTLFITRLLVTRLSSRTFIRLLANC